MNRFIICLLIVCMPATVLAQPQAASQDAPALFSAMFLAEPNTSNGTYEIYYGSNVGILTEYAGTVYALYDRDRPLDNYVVGEAEIQEFDEEWTIVTIRFTGDFTPMDGESVLVVLPVNTPNPFYQSVPYEFTTFGITLLDLEEEELLDLSMFVDDGLFAEHMVLSQLLEHIVAAAGDLREMMEEPSIDEGRYAGSGAFDAMEAADLIDIRDFMLYIIDNPVAYMGKSLKVAETYASWLLSGTPETESPRPLSGTPGIGFSMTEGGDEGYPKISQSSQVAFGMSNDVVLPGARVLAIDGESLYQQSPAQAMRQLEGGLFDIIEVTVLTPQNAVVPLEIALMPLPDEAGWLTDEPEGIEPRLYPIRKGDKWGFIDTYGDEIIEPQYDDVLSDLTNVPFSEGLEGVKVGDQWGFINLEGRMVISPRWVKVDQFEGGMAGFQNPEDNRIGIIGGRYGYIDRAGREVIPAQYDKTIFASGFSSGLSAVREDDLTGFMDKTGRVVIPLRYYFVMGFTEGLAMANEEEDGSYGYIDTEGGWVISPQYERANPFYDGMAFVQTSEGDSFEAIDKEGRTLFTLDLMPNTSMFTNTKYTEGRLRGNNENKKIGFMDERGQAVIPPIYSDSKYFFSEGLVGVTEGGRDPEVSIGSRIGGWHFIDRDGNTVIEGPYDEVGRFSEGVCWVKEIDGLWGLIDKTGDWVIEPEYDSQPLTFENGLSRIILRRDEGGLFKEAYNMYLTKDGYAAWRPFY